MSPLSSLTSMPPSTANTENSNQAQDPSQARFADVLRQRQAVTSQPRQAAGEAVPGAPSVAGDEAASHAAELTDGGGDRLAIASLEAGLPGSAPDHVQLPPLWTPPVVALRPAMAEAPATMNAAQRSLVDANALPGAGHLADQAIRPTEAGAGSQASVAIDTRTANNRSTRADGIALRMASLLGGYGSEQRTAGLESVAGTSGTAAEARPNGPPFDAAPARSDAPAWSTAPSPAEASRNAAPTPHTLSVDARVGTPRFIDETAQQVTWLAKNGIEHAEIRVKPAELGPISVRIEMQNNEAIISFAVTQPETRVAVEDALHRLQEMLAESGISMGETSVGGHDNFGQQPSDGREPARGRNLFAVPADLRGGPLETIGMRAHSAARGLVDTFA